MQKIVETLDFSLPLNEEISQYDNVMFVYSVSFRKRSAFSQIDRIPHTPFSDFEPNPDYISIVEGANLFMAQGCDCLVSIGGGSSIDVAKGIKHILKNKKLKHIAIPTTSGTGCESTQFAVVYKEGKKISLDSEELLPNVAILDGSLISTLSDFQKRCTLLDAMCQCIESHWSVNSTEESREYSTAGLNLILSNRKQYLKNDSEANKNILIGANFSGRAINITRTTAPHALSYVITKEYDVPHGCAVALTIVQFWKHLLSNLENTTHPMGEPFMEERLNELSRVFGKDTLSEGLDIANKIIIETLPEIHTEGYDVSKISSGIDADRLKNFPLGLSNDDILQITTLSLKPYSIRS